MVFVVGINDKMLVFTPERPTCFPSRVFELFFSFSKNSNVSSEIKNYKINNGQSMSQCCSLHPSIHVYIPSLVFVRVRTGLSRVV